MPMPNRLTVRQITEMVELYQAGWSQGYIAERFGVAQSTVHYHLHRHHSRIQFRGPGGNPGTLSHAEMERTVFLYTVAKLSIDDIAHLLHRNRTTIWGRLRRAGVAMRTPSERAKRAWLKRRKVS